MQWQLGFVTPRAFRRGLLAGCALLAAACGGQTATATQSDGAGTTDSGAATAPAATGAAGTAPAGTDSAAASAPARTSALSSDWRQFGGNAQSSGVGPANTGITTANAGRLRLREVHVDGVVDSAAIALGGVVVDGTRHDVLVVTTSYGKTIALDAGTGRALWEFRPSGVNSTPGNPQVVTAAPTADPDRRFVYSASPNGVIHKLSVASGHQVWSRRITFDPTHEKIASSLHTSGRWLVAVTGGYIGDAPPYDGHVVTIDRDSGRIHRVWNSECSHRHRLIAASSCSVTNTAGDNAIWGRAGAVIEPGSGRILVTTGNGPFDGRTSWGDSVLELAPDASRLLHNWTPVDQARLDAHDTDLGSTSPAILPPFHGRRLAVQGGKAGVLDLLDLDRLNGTRGGAGPRLGGQVSQTSAPGGTQVFTQPAVWTNGGRIYVFVADGVGTTAYQLVDAGHPRLEVVWQNGSAGTSPVVAGGLLYVFNPGGALNIRRPLNGALVRALSAGSGHWNSPIVVGGRIVEPTGAYGSGASSGTIDIWHLPGR
ncbi:MAG: PQQ-binding-like beta-propeller repeat protein [Solirubrobacteraceae bacterium]